MIISDLVLIAALAIFVVTWWMRRAPARRTILLLSALAGLGAGVYGVSVDRWQATLGVVASLVFLLVLLVQKIRRGPRTEGVPFISGSLLALVGALGSAALYLFPVPDLPRPSGEHRVGVRSFELVDRSRLGVFRAAKSEPRRLLVRVWYPAGNTDGLTRRQYFSAAEANNTARSQGLLFGFPPFLTYLKHVRTNSFEDAPLLAGAELPTVIYSHGYTSFLSQNTVLMEELASHGYIVYSVQHTYDSSATVFPDGEVAPMDPALLEQAPEAEGDFPEALLKGFAGESFDERIAGQLQNANETLARADRIVASAPVWVADRLFVHNQLAQGAVPESVADVVAASNLVRVGEMGMSFGGSTTGGVCMVDPRCAAGVNLDGGNFHFSTFDADMPQPWLMFHSDIGGFYKNLRVEAPTLVRSVNDFSYETFEHAGERDDIHRLQVKQAAHLGVSDFTLFMRRPVRDAILGTTPTKMMIGSQNDFVRGFFDKYLRGVDNEFPAAQYQKYRDWVVPYDNGAVRQWWLSKSEPEQAEIRRSVAELKARAEQPIATTGE